MPIILIGINWRKSSVAGTCFSAVEQPLAPRALGAPGASRAPRATGALPEGLGPTGESIGVIDLVHRGGRALPRQSVAPGDPGEPVEEGGAVLAAADAQRRQGTAQARMVYQPVQCERQAVCLTVNHIVNALVCARRGGGASHRDAEIDGRRPGRQVHERGPVMGRFGYGSIEHSWRMSVDG